MAQEKNQILCVCTANICRSPMAARLLAHALAAEAEPLNSLGVTSAGVAACTGERASANAVAALKKVGIDLDHHRSQPVSQELMESALAVFCMTESHRALLYYHFDPLPAPVYLMRELLPPPATPEIPDPYGMDLRAYEACRDSMVEAVPSILRFLRANYNGLKT
jgi:protein-tyrosine-phosphatase